MIERLNSFLKDIYITFSLLISPHLYNANMRCDWVCQTLYY